MKKRIESHLLLYNRLQDSELGFRLFITTAMVNCTFKKGIEFCISIPYVSFSFTFYYRIKEMPY